MQRTLVVAGASLMCAVLSVTLAGCGRGAAPGAAAPAASASAPPKKGAVPPVLLVAAEDVGTVQFV